MTNLFTCPICWNCHLEPEIELSDAGLCEDCERKLEQEKETGRCAWCGRPFLECECDD